MTLPSRVAALAAALLAVGCSQLAPVPDDAAPGTHPAITSDAPAPDAPSGPDVAPPAPAAPAAPATTAERAVRHALGMIGTPYRFGGTSPEGFDCSGLVRYSFGLAGYELPRDTREQRRAARTLARDESPLPGDLLFFRRGRRDANLHVGIYLGEGRFVHSPSRGGTVRIERLDDAHWRRTFIDARRVAAPRQMRAGLGVPARIDSGRSAHIDIAKLVHADAARSPIADTGQALHELVANDPAATDPRRAHVIVSGLRFAIDLH